MTDNKKDNLLAVAWLCNIVLGLIIVCGSIGGCYSKSTLTNLKSDAIYYGFAQYNPTNGVWQWKPNLTEKR